jgi:hypothetical protein
MHRVARWLLHGLTALSLLLGVATCVLWVRSYWVGSFFGDTSYRPGPTVYYVIEARAFSLLGELCYARTMHWADDPEILRQAKPHRFAGGYERHGLTADWHRHVDASVPHRVLGFGYSRTGKGRDHVYAGSTSWALAVPYWAVAAMLFALPAL